MQINFTCKKSYPLCIIIIIIAKSRYNENEKAKVNISVKVTAENSERYTQNTYYRTSN